MVFEASSRRDRVIARKDRTRRNNEVARALTGNAYSESFNFEPGKMNIVCDDDGFVWEVSAGGPAHNKGIKEGNRIEKVGPEPFSKDGLDKAEKSEKSYVVTVLDESKLKGTVFIGGRQLFGNVGCAGAFLASDSRSAESATPYMGKDFDPHYRLHRIQLQRETSRRIKECLTPVLEGCGRRCRGVCGEKIQEAAAAFKNNVTCHVAVFFEGTYGIGIQTNSCKHVIFKPGSMGITYDRKGFVDYISPEGQACAHGISTGDQIVTVDFEKYSRDAVARRESSGAGYEVTFKVKPKIELFASQRDLEESRHMQNYFRPEDDEGSLQVFQSYNWKKIRDWDKIVIKTEDEVMAYASFWHGEPYDLIKKNCQTCAEDIIMFAVGDECHFQAKEVELRERINIMEEERAQKAAASLQLRAAFHIEDERFRNVAPVRSGCPRKPRLGVVGFLFVSLALVCYIRTRTSTAPTVCSVTDGRNLSSSYPCTCGTKRCYNYQICNSSSSQCQALRDSHYCLRQAAEWSRDYDCSVAAQLCDKDAKTVRRCCPISCGMTYELTEDECNQMQNKGECDYPLPKTTKAFAPKLREELARAVKAYIEYGAVSAGYGNISIWNTAKVADMSNLFESKFTFNEPLDTWNTAQVTNMKSMFRRASAFNSPIDTWNTARVTNMWHMFEEAHAFNSSIGTWNTAQVQNMRSMFSRAKNFDQPLNGWSTERVTDMRLMFDHAKRFNSPIGTWNTAQVQNMESMFQKAQCFNQPLNSWSTEQVTDMQNMFSHSYKFNQNLTSWNTTKLTKSEGMFAVATAVRDDYKPVVR